MGNGVRSNGHLTMCQGPDQQCHVDHMDWVCGVEDGNVLSNPNVFFLKWRNV